MEENVYLKKSRLQQQIEYEANFLTITEQFLEWEKSRPDNPDLKKCASALAKIGIYVASIQMEQEGFEKIVSQYRGDKLRFQREAYEAAEKLRRYEDKYFNDDK